MYIENGVIVNFNNCDIYSNIADSVSACFVNFPGHFFHRPDGLTVTALFVSPPPIPR